MSRVPPDFGGFMSYWLDGHAYLVRYGRGKPIEGVGMTPLNVLQARKSIEALIEQGIAEGHITEEHLHQSEQLPAVPTRDFENIQPRSEVDKIAGPD